MFDRGVSAHLPGREKRRATMTIIQTERRQAGRTPRAGWAFIEQKRRDEARRLKRELAETRARMADYFFGQSVPMGGA